MKLQPFLVCLCCPFLICVPATGQDLQLDKLSDCNGLNRIESTLQQPISHSCRVTQDKLEERLMSRFLQTPHLNVCLLNAQPTQRLAGFSCFDLNVSGTRELLCFRIIGGRALRTYQDNYDPVQANRYKVAAAGCSVTNHDASEASNSLFPPAVSLIARARLGFIVGLGNSLIPLGSAYHGFGSIDPDLAESGSVLEVFDMFQYKQGQQPNQALSDSSDKSGEWNFDINDMPRESQRDFARPYQQASGERIGVRIRLITITSTRSSDISFQDRINRLDSWQQAVADDLRNESFRRLTHKELASTPFSNEDAIRNFIVKNVPFGNRDLMRRTIGPHLVFLVNEEDDDCNKVAEAFVAEPEEGVKNDHGAIGLSIFTIGRCRSDGGPDHMLDDMIEQETKVIENEVKKP